MLIRVIRWDSSVIFVTFFFHFRVKITWHWNNPCPINWEEREEGKFFVKNLSRNLIKRVFCDFMTSMWVHKDAMMTCCWVRDDFCVQIRAERRKKKEFWFWKHTQKNIFHYHYQNESEKDSQNKVTVVWKKSVACFCLFSIASL